MDVEEVFDMVVVGGGPAGATAANDLANLGRKVALIDRSGRIKPCGGAIPPRLIKDFEIPQLAFEGARKQGDDGLPTRGERRYAD